MSTHPTPDAPSSEPDEQPTGKKPRRGRRFWILLALGVILCGWLIYDRLDEPDAGNTGSPAGTPTQQPASAAAAVAVAVAYETRSLAGNVDGACQLDVREAVCRAGFGSSPRAYALSAPVQVESTQRLESQPGAVRPSAYDAVVVTWTIEGQAPQRAALLITTASPRKVQAEELIGSDKAGLTLAQIFAGEIQ